MAIIREPIEIDFLIQSSDWTVEELAIFRKHLAEQKKNNQRAKIKAVSVNKTNKFKAKIEEVI